MNSIEDSTKLFVLHPKPGIKTFEVIHRQYSGDWVDKTIQYEMQVTLLNNVSQNGFVYELDRKNLLIDGSTPDLVFDQLAFDCGNALFPLKFLVTSLGEIEQIFEHEKMLQRWEIIKNKLINYYEGDTALEYIQMTDTNIKNSNLLKSIMQNHLFVYFFFKPLYGHYQDNTKVTQWKAAPFMDFSIDIPMQQVLVKKKGVNNDEIVTKDEIHIEIQSESEWIDMYGKYTFHPKDNSLVSCEASMVLSGNEEIKLTMNSKQENWTVSESKQRVESSI